MRVLISLRTRVQAVRATPLLFFIHMFQLSSPLVHCATMIRPDQHVFLLWETEPRSVRGSAASHFRGHRTWNTSSEVWVVGSHVTENVTTYVPVASPVVCRLKMYPPIGASPPSKRKLLSGLAFPASMTTLLALVDTITTCRAVTVIAEEDTSFPAASQSSNLIGIVLPLLAASVVAYTP